MTDLWEKVLIIVGIGSGVIALLICSGWVLRRHRRQTKEEPAPEMPPPPASPCKRKRDEMDDTEAAVVEIPQSPPPGSHVAMSGSFDEQGSIVDLRHEAHSAADQAADWKLKGHDIIMSPSYEDLLAEPPSCCPLGIEAFPDKIDPSSQQLVSI